MSATMSARVPEHRLRHAVESIVPPIVFGVAFVVFWEIIVKAFDINP
jgi:hypothetical protein